MTALHHEERFDALIKKLATSSHGSQELGALKAFLANDLKKDREAFLLPRLAQAAVTWLDVKERIWPTPADQEKNQFPFLQGDIIATTMVLALGMAESSQRHNLWLVLTPDCDCVRAKFVRVAAVFPVYSGNKANPESSNRFGHALKLATTRIFPLPKLAGDELVELRGYFADLETPYYITHADKGLATACASLTVTGWHLLNALIQDKETRAADMAEAVAIRR